MKLPSTKTMIALVLLLGATSLVEMMTVKGETIRHRVYISQIVVVRCMDSAIELMAEPITNSVGQTIYEGRPGQEEAMVNNVIAFMQSKFPAKASIMFLNWHTDGHLLRKDAQGNIAKGNIKIVEIHAQSSLEQVPHYTPLIDPVTGEEKLRWGFTYDGEDGNAQRFGKAYINMSALRQEFFKEYEHLVNEDGYSHADALDVIAGKMDMVAGFWSTHEIGHTLGLVSVNYLYGDPTLYPGEAISENRLDNPQRAADTVYMMDPELMFYLILMIGDQIEFIQLNKDYLLFILPQPEGD